MHRSTTTVLLALLAMGSLATAVTPGIWRHEAEGDFAPAERDATVVDSRGDVQLARDIQLRMPSDEAPAVVSAVAEIDGVAYAASGVDGWVYRIANGKAVSYKAIPSTLITSMVRRGSSLLVGGAGDKAGLYEITAAGQVRELFADDAIRYVWAIVPDPKAKGVVYIATGPEAKVYRVSADGKGEVVYDGSRLAKNILCLIRRKDGKLLAGTDDKGLVLEIDPRARTGRVLLDAAETEISALALAADGGVFAATGDASGATGRIGPGPGKTGKPTSAPAPKAGAPSLPPEVPTRPEPVREPEPKPEAPRPDQKPAAEPPAEKDPAQDTPSDDDTEDAPADAEPEDDDDEAAPEDRPQDDGEPEAESPDQPVAPWRKTTVATSQPATQPARSATTQPAGGSGEANGNTKPADAAKMTGKATTKIAGSKPTATSLASASSRPATKRSTSSSAASSKSGAKGGNAVYHIAPDGMVREVLRQPMSVQAMVRQDDRLLLGTGNEGRLRFVTVDGMLYGDLIDTEAKQVTALFAAEDGSLLFGTSNAGSVGRIADARAKRGTLTSKPLDAKQIAQWGTIQLTGSTPPGTRVTVATRSGNLGDASGEGWSSWTSERPVTNRFLPIASPAGRFLQYRLTLSGKRSLSPIVGSVQVIYQVGNLAPVVSAVKVVALNYAEQKSAQQPSRVYRHVAIQAADPNKDKLVYRIDYRNLDSKVWVNIAEKLTDAKYIWDTRTVADGRYELRVTASDSPTNGAPKQAARVSEAITVDNTAPVLRDLSVKVNGRAVHVSGTAVDAGSRIVRMQYSVDSSREWKAFLPTDGICDSGREPFAVEIPDLKPGKHRVTVRVTDLLGNTVYGGTDVTIGK